MNYLYLKQQQLAILQNMGHEEDTVQIKFGQNMGDGATMAGMVNGMIGGTILVLPLLGLKTGYITTIIVNLLVGYTSYYTANLYVVHLGKQKDIREAVLVHFNFQHKYVKLFSFLMWFGFAPLFLQYFRLMCIQAQGLLGSQSLWIANGLLIGLVLLVIIIRTYHISQQTVALGILSTIVYTLFILWGMVTAPSGPRQVQPFGEPFQLAATLVGGYSIHNFIAHNIVKNPVRKNYSKVVIYSFVIGCLAYFLFSEGSFVIINRIVFKANPETIYDYFQGGEWQILIIQIIYLFHFISVLPNFIIISKVQFFNMFQVKVQGPMRWFEYAYIFLTLFSGYIFFVLDVKLVTIMILNGTVVCFTYVIAFPIWMHIKCIFIDRSSGFIEGDQEWNKSIKLNRCSCQYTFSSKWTFYLETFFAIFTIVFGFFFCYHGLKTLNDDKGHHH